MLTEEWASRGVRGLQSPGPRRAASSSTLGLGMRGTWCSASQQEVTHPLEKQDPRSTLSPRRTPSPALQRVAGSQAEHQLISIFSLFLLCSVLFRACPCMLCVACVHLSPVLSWPGVSPPTCLPPAAGSPGVGVGSVQCQAAGHGAGWQLPAPSSPPAPICLPVWLVSSSPVSLGPLPISLSFAKPLPNFFCPHVSISSCLSASSVFGGCLLSISSSCSFLSLAHSLPTLSSPLSPGLLALLSA